MRRTARMSLVAAIAVAVAVLELHAALPSPRGPVNDLAHVLDASTLSELTALVADVREKTTAEIAVVTVPSLDGMSVEDYASKLFNAWGIGKKGRDNGVLVLVAPAEHRMRIEVGYGLEPVLPDGLAGEIIRTDCTPEFKANNYSTGILRGTHHVADIVVANHTLTPAERDALSAITPSQRIMLTVVILFFMPMGMGAIGSSIRTKSLVPIVLCGIYCVPAMCAPFFIPGAGLTMRWLVASSGILALIFGWRSAAAERRSFEHGARKRKFGWIAGLSGSGSKSSGKWSSGSGGGFGGGSSGGGGASGSW
jgi:uncharacterized protein